MAARRMHRSIPHDADGRAIAPGTWLARADRPGMAPRQVESVEPIGSGAFTVYFTDGTASHFSRPAFWRALPGTGQGAAKAKGKGL